MYEFLISSLWSTPNLGDIFETMMILLLVQLVKHCKNSVLYMRNEYFSSVRRLTSTIQALRKLKSVITPWAKGKSGYRMRPQFKEKQNKSLSRPRPKFALVLLTLSSQALFVSFL